MDATPDPYRLYRTIVGELDGLSPDEVPQQVQTSLGRLLRRECDTLFRSVLWDAFQRTLAEGGEEIRRLARNLVLYVIERRAEFARLWSMAHPHADSGPGRRLGDLAPDALSLASGHPALAEPATGETEWHCTAKALVEEAARANPDHSRVNQAAERLMAVLHARGEA